MSKITVFRSRIEISSYTLGDCPRVERVFSIYDKLYHASFPKGMIYDSDNCVLKLPRGIDVGWLERLFQERAEYMDGHFDECIEMPGTMLKYKPRDEIQQQAIRFMLGIGEYSNLFNAGLRSVNLNTGKGKSYCSIASIACMGLRSIIITNAVEWLNQWRNYILEYTNLKPENIYFIDGSSSIIRLLKKDTSNIKIFLCTHATIKSFAETHGWNAIGAFFRDMKFGIKLYDEAHLNFDNMCYIDFYTNTKFTFYLTATPGRSNPDENFIFEMYFKNVPCIDLFDEDNDPHTKYIAIKFNSRPTPVEISRCKNRYGLDRNKYTSYVVEKENFYNVLRILLDIAINKPGKFLFYIGVNDSILYVRDWIYSWYPYLVGDVGIFSTITPGDKKAELNKKIILSTTKSAGAAVDIKGLASTVVLAEPFKSHVLARQTLGRTRDDDTVYYDVVDEGFLYTKKFYKHKQPVFARYATECKEIRLDDKTLSDKAEELQQKNFMRIMPMVFFDDPPIEPFIIE